MQLVYGHNQTVAQWVASLIGNRARFGENCTAIGVMDGDKAVGGFVYHNYDPDAGTIEMSAAGIGKRWMTRPVLYGLFSYPFDQLKCQLLYSQVSERNKPLLRITKAYGFTQVRVPRWYGRDEAAILCSLTDDAWRGNGFHKDHNHG